ncbi:nucleotide-binding universal stress UspA family protein [Gillisia sp. Hel_I_86]|uniref:universal stress protein n=1 Tax=Gillisia sp. Hel_I_86 TaxID=1249981 RepID=UPI00119A1872|nr:universal stress protein [Gillisia sp. Hel_I_86]TVZ28383.1 nucleotide-binding universal stress UspA family protein [Gillisia sp. Hel_I_86]
MKKVLICIDYNPTSEMVANSGYELAKSLNAEVCLLHVIADVQYYGVQYPTFMGYNGFDAEVDLNINKEMKRVAGNFLDTVKTHFKDPKVETKVLEGSTADMILEYASHWNANTIVLGTHSHSILEKIFIGDVASKVLKDTKVPVYMVPTKE